MTTDIQLNAFLQGFKALRNSTESLMKTAEGIAADARQDLELTRSGLRGQIGAESDAATQQALARLTKVNAYQRSLQDALAILDGKIGALQFAS